MDSRCDNNLWKKRDQDEFAQKVVQQKNSYHAEISFLKKKILEITKKNEELEQKVEQLDEDTNDGEMMLQNSHERERKLQIELDETKKKNLNTENTENEKNEIQI